jgi:hypothetical protein
MHSHIDHAAGNDFSPDLAEAIGQATGKVNAAALNANDYDFLIFGFIALGDLRSHAFDGAMDNSGSQKRFGFSHFEKGSPYRVFGSLKIGQPSPD